MIKKGLIVSIQGFSENTTFELSSFAINGGAVAIRTDQPIICEVPIIGLCKDMSYKNYITPTREHIIELQKWTNIIAIDSRKSNQSIDVLYSHCQVNNLSVVADIETIEDVENILNVCEQRKIIKPLYISTTFDFNSSLNDKIEKIKEIKKLTDINIIAEGGYNKKYHVRKVKPLVNNICIGNAISNIHQLTEGLCY